MSTSATRWTAIPLALVMCAVAGTVWAAAAQPSNSGANARGLAEAQGPAAARVLAPVIAANLDAHPGRTVAEDWVVVTVNPPEPPAQRKPPARKAWETMVWYVTCPGAAPVRLGTFQGIPNLVAPCGYDVDGNPILASYTWREA